MAAKGQWARHSNGPDETDVETMMRAIGVLHTGRVELTVSPLGIGSTGGVLVKVSMSFEVLPGSALKGTVQAEGAYPNPKSKSFWGHVYALLAQLDWDVSEVYKQERLWT